MAKSNRDKVDAALKLLNQGVLPFIEREMQSAYGEAWRANAWETLDHRARPSDPTKVNWDTTTILSVLWSQWNAVFRNVLGHAERSLVSEIRQHRNDWAHQKAFSTDDTYRVMDSIVRLLTAVSAGEEATEVEKQKQEVLRLKFAEQTRSETRKIARGATEGRPKSGLQPWREIVEPHQDVASGHYRQAEFAADLWQVHQGTAADEYLEPVEFFRRTFLTQGLRNLLATGIKRIVQNGGDPVVALQTNFGGGKTHSLLALYHLFSGTTASQLPNVDTLMAELGVDDIPQAQRAVLVGQYTSPGKTHVKTDGTKINTLWGELAWQLCGRKGFDLVKQSDENRTNPGDDLVKLFDMAGPCLILIDEWVAYARQLYTNDDLPAGTFDTQFTFAQALTEAASASKNTLLVVAVPSSDIETGGQAGKEALNRLENVISRKEATWQPASTEEGFEIVRRRLFQSIEDPDRFKARDTTIHAFIDFYRQNTQDFPQGCSSAEYEKRMIAAYPIHPDVFDRLYTEWSTLDRFQRTRGVLRLMAAVIHELWERQDQNLLILPGMLPLDEPPVRSELTRYLEPGWHPVVESDVDGPESTPLAIDREITNLGRYSATRRVARTVFLGTAPLKGVANRGKDIRQINLGCVQPGESLPTFGDALRRLQNKATYLNTDGERSYYDTQQNINRDAESRKDAFARDDVLYKIRDVLQKQRRTKGDFVGVISCPQSPSDVADDREARLVILGPEAEHLANKDDSPALQAAAEILASRGSGPRMFRNTLAFVAVDRTRLGDLEDAIRWAMAWAAIDDKKEELNLDPTQVRTAKAKRKEWEGIVEQRIPEAYCWLIVPGQSDVHSATEWQSRRLSGQDTLAERASKKMKSDELLITHLGAVRLRMELDKIPLWRGDDVEVRQLAEDFAQYLYLPRLRGPSVLIGAIAEGVGLITWQNDAYAYAERKDEKSGRYEALRCGEQLRISLEAGGLVVRSDVAAKQRDDEVDRGGDGPGNGEPPDKGDDKKDQPDVTPKLPTRFFGLVDVDATRLGRDAGKITEEVITHLSSLDEAEVAITLEIKATLSKGFKHDVVRVVTENCRTLNFKSQAFEEA